MTKIYCAKCLRTSTVVDMSKCPFCDEKRTLTQNNSLHKWCELIANAYTEKGFTVEEVLKNFKMELYWTKESVKELIIRTAIIRMFGKRSTTELLKSGEEIEKLVDVVTKFNAQMEIDYIPWPSIEELENEFSK